MGDFVMVNVGKCIIYGSYGISTWVLIRFTKAESSFTIIYLGQVHDISTDEFEYAYPPQN